MNQNCSDWCTVYYRLKVKAKLAYWASNTNIFRKLYIQFTVKSRKGLKLAWLLLQSLMIYRDQPRRGKQTFKKFGLVPTKKNLQKKLSTAHETKKDMEVLFPNVKRYVFKLFLYKKEQGKIPKTFCSTSELVLESVLIKYWTKCWEK